MERFVNAFSLDRSQILFHCVLTMPTRQNLDWTKLKAFADDKLHVTKMILFAFDRVENIVGKGEIACISNFSFSHNVFKRFFSQVSQKVSQCGNGLKSNKLGPKHIPSLEANRADSKLLLQTRFCLEMLY